MASKTVYAVSSGDYSDYRVLCVCEDKATAQAFVDAYARDSGEYAQVESMELYPAGEEIRRVATHRSEAVLHDDGTVSDERFWDFSGLMFDPYHERPPVRPHVEYCRAPILKNQGGYLRVYGRTRKAVEKVMHDRIAAFKDGSWRPQQ